MTPNNSPINKLVAIDKELSSIFTSFNEIVDELEFSPICLLSEKEKIKACKYSGIYLIEIAVSDITQNIKIWLDEFEEIWECSPYKDSHTPSIKKKRISKHQKLEQWMPIYLGKSKEISKRVIDHLDQPLDKTMFALKLSARKNLSLELFRLRALNLGDLTKENYDLIVPRIESCLREKLNPIVGKQ